MHLCSTCLQTVAATRPGMPLKVSPKPKNGPIGVSLWQSSWFQSVYYGSRLWQSQGNPIRSKVTLHSPHLLKFLSSSKYLSIAGCSVFTSLTTLNQHGFQKQSFVKCTALFHMNRHRSRECCFAYSPMVQRASAVRRMLYRRKSCRKRNRLLNQKQQHWEYYII